MRGGLAPECPQSPLALPPSVQAELLCGLNTSEKCEIDLQWGFFFDGTNNKLSRDKPQKAQSNVARLFELFPKTPDNQKIPRYADGAGTPFLKEVGDTGQGIHQKAGLAAGWGGESRVCWGLLQFLDNLREYLVGEPFSKAWNQDDRATVREMASDITLSTARMEKEASNPDEAMRMLAEVGVGHTLHGLGLLHSTVPNDAGRRRILALRRQHLTKLVEDRLRKHVRPRIRSIQVSIFGFSRGATQARVFTNWLRDACDGGDALTLCGIPVEVRFLGIFDTVASVGMAHSSLLWDGHGNYAAPQNMVIPSYVGRCLHLVAAHEPRASFPLDLATGSNVEEYVYPGVHSDVGGGYPPGEQGKAWKGGAPDDRMKLSQVPLAHMYREAIRHGVPLDITSARPESRAAMQLDPELVRYFNEYLHETRRSGRSGTRQVMEDQYNLYMRWRRLRLREGSMLHEQSFATRARKYKSQDYMDLVGANKELAEEWRFGENVERNPNMASWAGDAMLNILSGVVGAISGPFKVGSRLKRAVESAVQHKRSSWQRLKPHWADPAPLAYPISRLFDDLVHDSRAWFKPFGAASEDIWVREQEDAALERFEELETKRARRERWVHGKSKPFERAGSLGVPSPLTPDEHREWSKLRSLKRSQELRAKSRLTPAEQQELERLQATGWKPALEASGREDYRLAGFFRYRVLFSPANMPARVVASADDANAEVVV